MDIFSTNQIFEMGQVQSQNGGSFGPVYQSHLGLILMLKGKIKALIDDYSYPLHSSQVGFFYAHSAHKLEYETDEVSYLWCANSLNPGSGYVALKESLDQLDNMPNVLNPSKTLCDLMWLGVGMHNRRGLAAQRVRTTIAESVFNEYFYIAGIHEEDNIMPTAVTRARRYITANYNKASCNSKDIASAADMSTQHLSKLFKQYMKCTPVKYLWQLRGERAIHLLKYSNQNASNVATLCGFKDPFHFSRFIRKKYGYSPRQIRERHWQSNVS